MGPIWAKAVDYVMQNARALLDAPLVFLAVLLIAFGASYWFNGLRYQGALDAKSSTIESLKSQIDGLQDKIRDLQAKFADNPVRVPSAALARDPDGIFQLDVQVGSVRLPQVDESRSQVFFDSIVGAVNFDINKDFQYRDFKLHVKTSGTESRFTMAGQKGRALGQVMCEIVGRLSQP